MRRFFHLIILRWWVFLIFCIVLLIATAWDIEREYKNNMEEQFISLEHQAQVSTAEIFGLLRGIDVGLQSLVSDQQAVPRIPSAIAGQRLQAFLDLFPEVNTILVTDAKGNIELAETILPAAIHQKILSFNAAERDYFNFHKNAEEADLWSYHITRPFLAISQAQVFGFSRAIRGPNGEFKGVVSAALEPRVFSSVMNSVLLDGVADAVAIHNRSGDILYRLPDPDKYIGKNIASGDAFQSYLKSPSILTRYSGIVKTDQQKRVLVFGRIGQTGLDVGISGRYDRIFSKWQSYAVNHSLGALFIIGLAGGLNLSLLRRRESANALLASEKRYRTLVHDANEGIAVIQDEKISFANPKLYDIFDSSEHEVDRAPFLTYVYPEDRELVLQNHRLRNSGCTAPARYTFRVQTPAQKIKSIEINVASVEWEGRPATLCFITDITDRLKMENIIRQMAFNDALTGLPNRRLLDDRLELAIENAKQNDLAVGVLFIDLNEFKPVNDTYGHDVGDWLLKEFAIRLQGCLRESDTIARIGGDEFVVVLPAIHQSQEAIDVASKLQQCIAYPFVTDQGVKLNISASIGVVNYPEHASTPGELLYLSDVAMYRIKKNRVFN